MPDFSTNSLWKREILADAGGRCEVTSNLQATMKKRRRLCRRREQQTCFNQGSLDRKARNTAHWLQADYFTLERKASSSPLSSRPRVSSTDLMALLRTPNTNLTLYPIKNGKET